MKEGRAEMVLGYNFFQNFKIFKNVFSKIKKKKKDRINVNRSKILQL